MVRLTPFRPADFDRFIAWVDSPELLVTIAGTDLQYPLTADQLQAYLEGAGSWAFNILDTSSDYIIGHAELRYSGNKRYKIDKLLIGDPSTRGKGYGGEVIRVLVEYAYSQLDADTIELNVFDWNTGAIRCYEKCGFLVTPGVHQQFRMGDEEWTTINMTLRKQNDQRQNDAIRSD